MEIARDIPAIRRMVRDARKEGRTIGLVPTMGALHAGHISLIEASVKRGDWTVASIFVNPTQFGPHEDLEKYPRNEAGDLKCCEDAGVSAVFLPGVREMYPPESVTAVDVSHLTDTLCGPLRPGHFRGVATIVSKLFNIVLPDRAYFGQKDAQQLAVLRRMTADLDFPIEIVGCPTVREPDGLAMSSRNAYLSDAERQQATCLYQTLVAARDAIAAGTRDVSALEKLMREMIRSSGPCDIDYASVVDAYTMQPIETIDRRALIALAVHIGRARLIDNIEVDPPSAAT
jgi:pantoate--beta-alanine ligase